MNTTKMFIGLLLLFFSCTEKKESKSYSSLPGYDISKPVIVHLRTDLDEISGIAYYPKDSSVFAINDELGVLYKIYIRKQIQVKKWKFSNDADYEDIVLHNNTFYVLQSNGDLKAFTIHSKDSVQMDVFRNPVPGTNNFETIYYDESSGRIVMVCKNCPSDNKKTISGYAFNPVDQTFSEEVFLKLDIDDIADKIGHGNIKFKPSAAAIHPKTKDLYIISSVEKAIVVASTEGRIKYAIDINPIFFKQPEGLTFTPAGDMLVSNESAEIGAPTILIFKYKPELNEKG